MRPDFQCGICRQLVPEFYYGGCCAMCSRIRCNNCMRQCPVCAAQLCPDCLGAPRADGRCSHAAVPPAAPLIPDYVPPVWRPPTPAPSPLRALPTTTGPTRQRNWPRWLAMVIAVLMFIPLYALLELMIAELVPPLALVLVATLGGASPAPWLACGALALAWLLVCAIVAARAEPGVPRLLPLATALIALALERWIGLNDFAYGVALPLAAAYAGLCVGGAFGALWSKACTWRRACLGVLLGLLPLAFTSSRIDDVAGLAFVFTHLLLLLLLPPVLRPWRSRHDA